MYDRVAGPKKSGHNNEMTRPDYRGGRKVGFYCTMVSYPSYTTIIYYCACIECDNRTFIVSTFSWGSDKTIQMRYAWTHIF